MNDQETNGRIPGKASAPTVAIRKKLGDITHHEIIPYATVSEWCLGRDVRPGGAGYSYLQSARRIVLREDGKVFLTIPNQGIRLARPEEVPEEATRYRKAVHRKSRRALDVAGSVDVNVLDKDTRAVHFANVAVLSAVRKVTGDAARKRLEAKQDELSKIAYDPMKVLEALKDR